MSFFFFFVVYEGLRWFMTCFFSPFNLEQPVHHAICTLLAKKNNLLFLATGPFFLFLELKNIFFEEYHIVSVPSMVTLTHQTGNRWSRNQGYEYWSSRKKETKDNKRSRNGEWRRNGDCSYRWPGGGLNLDFIFVHEIWIWKLDLVKLTRNIIRFA